MTKAQLQYQVKELTRSYSELSSICEKQAAEIKDQKMMLVKYEELQKEKDQLEKSITDIVNGILNIPSVSSAIFDLIDQKIEDAIRTHEYEYIHKSSDPYR